MRRAALLAVVGVVVLFYSSPAPAQSNSSSLGTAAVAGTTIIVNSKGDGAKTGNCTLREAIDAANTNLAVDGCAAGSSTDRDAIHFALGEQARITLGSRLHSIKDPSGLSIDGQKNKITVSGDEKWWGFFVDRGAKLSLLHLTVANARNGGLLNNNGQVEVSNSTFSGNHSFEGGAIGNYIGTLTVRNSTFSDNSADTDGGGISNTGTLKVSNSTFSGNHARGSEPPRLSSFSGGGGIANVFGTLTVSNSTFSKNGARIGPGGIRNDRGKVTLKNTIVANSTNGKNCSTRIIDAGYNIDDGTSCGFSAAKNSLPSTNPKLASSLANNGGPTKTIALLTGSPAINAIPNTRNGCGTKITTDQRGVSRPQGNRCDIGAFEKRQ
jgi:CSLREA domain-containing protein